MTYVITLIRYYEEKFFMVFFNIQPKKGTKKERAMACQGLVEREMREKRKLIPAAPRVIQEKLTIFRFIKIIKDATQRV